jgi:hypothetical protein
MADPDHDWPSPKLWDKVARLTPEARQMLMDKLQALLEEMDRNEDLADSVNDLALPD